MSMPKGFKMSEETKRKMSLIRTGKKHTMEARKAMSLAAIGKPGTNTGKKFNEQWRKRISLSQKGKKLTPEHIAKITEEKHPNWKGDNVGYGGLHIWIRKQLGQPDTCVNCLRSGLAGRKIHWANKSHNYKRDLNDWLRLCVPCHRAYDTNKLIIE